jgi:ribosomal protein S2
MKIYGPYTRKDGRSHIIKLYKSGRRVTQSYPRYLMEKFLGRKLRNWEEVDHINDDYTDDRIENFQILTKTENIDKSRKPAKIYRFICPVCKQNSSIPYSQYKHNQLQQGKAGPYCSRNCSGKMHN